METRRVMVPVATVWKSKDAPRTVDQPELKGDVKTWVDQMTNEQSVDLCDSDLLQTQVLFNDELLIDFIEGGWAKVNVVDQADDSDRRGYPGWIPTASLADTQLAYQPTTRTIRIAKRVTNLFNEKKQPIMELSLGTILPEVGTDGDWIKVNTPIGEGLIQADAIVVPYQGENAGEIMVEMADQFLGMRYLWGGISSYGYDCSGLSYAMHRALGFVIPRDADDQRNSGMVVSPENVLPGDLVFFAYDHGQGFVHHVGMYIGNGKMIESRTPGASVDIAKLTEPNFAAQFAGFRRFWR